MIDKCRLPRHFICTRNHTKIYPVPTKKERPPLLPQTWISLIQPSKKEGFNRGESFSADKPMIRLFHPLFKLWRKKISDINWFNQEVSGINPATLTCPYCGAEGTCISCHHPYHRYLVYLGPDNRPVSAVVKVPRVECTSCGHTHALLPCPVIPFGSYSLPFIFRILFLYFTHSMTIEELCARGGFSHSTLYKWKQCFLSHKKMYLGLLLDMERTPADFIQSLSVTDAGCFHTRFGFSFLQKNRMLKEASHPGHPEQLSSA